ncbi:MAG: hypothetical protein K9W43_06695 [Candidatus Thorarchaeota archaeon]|nr:hypothetical protein [Candidatus Thorarchaeota archaeon]
MPTSQEHLEEARTLHGRGEFKKGMKEALKARKKFLKEDQQGQATEALRVMADCTLNQHDFQEAKRLYKELLEEAHTVHATYYEAAANWGLGEIANHQMNYRKAAIYFELGLHHARSVSDKWFVAWNAFGLGKALRGQGKASEAIPYLQEGKKLFLELGHAAYASWVEKMLDEMGGDEIATAEREVRIWLCPLCGSKFNQNEAQAILTGKMATCQYCGTTVG